MVKSCTEASLSFFINQLRSFGVSGSDCKKIIGSELPFSEPFLNKRNDASKIRSVLCVLQDFDYQRSKELETLDKMILKKDIHQALYSNSRDGISLINNFIKIANVNLPLFSASLIVSYNRACIEIDSLDTKLESFSMQGFFYSLSKVIESSLSIDNIHELTEIGVKANNIPDENKIVKNVTSTIRTNTTKNYISFPKKILSIKNSNHNPLIVDFIDNCFNREYGINKGTDNLVSSTIDIISSIISKDCGDISIDAVSKKLNMSRSTLYRNLNERGVTFTEILDSQRRKNAIDYILKTNASFDEISERLGYSNLAAFYRAFKRWYGTTPLIVRKNNSYR